MKISCLRFFALSLICAATTWSAFGQTSDRTVTVSALTPYILKVDNTAEGEAPSDVQSVLPLSAVDNPVMVVGGSSGNMTGSICTSAGITASYSDGVLTIEGGRTGTTIVDRGYRGHPGAEEIVLENDGRGSFYGTGERGHKYNLRGDTLVMYNRQNYGYTGDDPRISQMNITMPLFLSSDGYAIVFDDYAAAELILGEPIRYISESRKPISYYYVGGVTTLAELTEQLSTLTGRQPLPPLWSLGYITSKYGYHTQQEAEGAVDTLKTAGFPLDGIVLDLYWYGKEEDMGRLEWDESQWPDPEGMLSSLNDKGVKTVAISQPYVLRNGRGVENYNELMSKDMLVKDTVGNPLEVKIWVGRGGMLDVANPDTRSWLADRYASLTDRGMGGWWGDLGEPEVHPDSALHANGLTTRLYHNKYGNDWSEIIYNLYRDRYPDRRLMTLMRGGTTGLQRYSVFPWSTDVSRSWGGFEPQVRIMLNSGLSGLGYMSSDLGGFAVGEEAYMPELYVRWVEEGLFSPVFRTHAQQYAEPYHYPQYEELLRNLVKERYRWLPYNYTLAYENATKGWPLVRPLDFDMPGKGEYDDISDEYLWGSEVLVAPVMKPGLRSRNVILPAGSRWVDYRNTVSVYPGGTMAAAYPAPLEVVPLFVRAGAFIPTADYPMENTGDYRSNLFTINYYPLVGVRSEYTLYDDNHISPSSLEKKEFRLIKFRGDCTEKHTEINISSEGTYPGAPETVELQFAVNCMSRAPKAVEVDGKKTQYLYSPTKRTIDFTVNFVPGKDNTVIIKY